MGKKFFNLSVVRLWNRFSREVVNTSFLKVFQAMLDGTQNPGLMKGMPFVVGWNFKVASLLTQVIL